MNQETRIQKIQDLVNRNKDNPYSYLEIPWNWKLRKFPVYEIPLEYLIFNQHNWRIRMRTKTYESQNHKIAADTPMWKEIIANFLYESSDRNKKTEEDIELYWQKIPGIITQDGVIVDGNRRAMLLNRLQFSKFKAVVLDCKLEDDPIAIEELETRYQLGEDEKVWYNPIEKYLKVSWLKKEWVSYEKIAEWMNELPWEIKFMGQVMNIMEEYLEYYWFNWLYTQLDKREDPFRSLTKWVHNLSDWKNPTWSQKGFSGYTQGDVIDLKSIAFDYIRIQYTWEGKSFRKIAEWNKESHFFWDKDIWNSFSKAHFDFIEHIKDEEPPIDKGSKNLEAHLNDRDEKFQALVVEFLADNLSTNESKIGNRKAKDKPYKLISEALDKIKYISDSKKEFDSNTVKQLDEIQKRSKILLWKQSPILLLDSVIIDLRSINFESLWEYEEGVLEKIKEIQHEIYEIKKGLGA